MSKERIVNIKNMIDSMDFYGHLLHEDAQEFMWLVEQAERVQDLEDELIVQKECFEELQNNHIRVCNQNKLYREAIGNIIKLWDNATESTDDRQLTYLMYEQALKALEDKE